MAMTLTLFLNFITYFLVVLISLKAFKDFRKNKKLENISKIFLTSGIPFLIISIMNFIWFFGLLQPAREDFLIIYYLFTVSGTIFLTYLIYNLTSNKNLLYYLLIYILSLISVSVSIKSFFIISMILSFILLLICFIDLYNLKGFYIRYAVILGFGYIFNSIIFLYVVFKNLGSYDLLWFIPNVLFFILFLLIYVGIKENYSRIKQKKEIKATKELKNKFYYSKVRLIKDYSSFLILILSITMFILLSTISLHEVGHAITAKFYGCEHSKAVIYDILGPPHTEIMCKGHYNNTILTLGGLFSTLLLFIIFYSTGEAFIKKISLLILSYSFLISEHDFRDLGFSDNIIVIITILSVLSLIYSNIIISLYLIEKKFNKNKKEYK